MRNMRLDTPQRIKGRIEHGKRKMKQRQRKESGDYMEVPDMVNREMEDNRDE